MAEQIKQPIDACAAELEAGGMTDEAAAYRAMIFTGLSKLDELLSADRLLDDLLKARAYVDHLLGDDIDEPRH